MRTFKTPRKTEEAKKERARQYKIDTMERKVRLHDTKCICPRCRQEHKMRTYHIGKEPARKNCHNCAPIMDNDYEEVAHSFGYSGRRGASE
jgi:transposase-like protein